MRESTPIVILGHGLGASREMRLDAFAERFAQAGIAALAFTHLALISAPYNLDRQLG